MMLMEGEDVAQQEIDNHRKLLHGKSVVEITWVLTGLMKRSVGGMRWLHDSSATHGSVHVLWNKDAAQ